MSPLSLRERVGVRVKTAITYPYQLMANSGR